MVSQTLVIEAHKKQLFHMFNLRGLWCSAKDFHFVVVLLSAVFILVTCTKSAVNEVQNQYEFEACRSYWGNFDSLDVIDIHVDSESVSRHPVQQHNLEDEYNPSNSFCFPSTLSGFGGYKTGAELEVTDASKVQSEVFSSGLNQKSSYLSKLPYHGSFRFLGRTNISCSLYHGDGFPEFPSSNYGTKNGLSSDASSCVTPLFDTKTHSSISVGKTEPVNFSFEHGLSTPPVEIKPSLLDWGYKNLRHPSLAYLTVKNLDADNVLTVYDPSSSDSQFYPCDSSAVLLAPGKEASICFIYFPTHLGLSSAKLILQTSFGGFLVQAKGFSVESPYLISSLSGLEISSTGRWRKNLSLFNSFDEALHVEELTAWISTFSGNTSRSSKSICRAHSKGYPGDYNMLNAKDWLASEREVGKPQIALRPHKNWVVGPKERETIAELDISGHFEGKVVGAICMKLLRFPNNEVDTVMIPLEAELSPTTALDTGLVSLSLEVLVPCNTYGSIGVALSVRNDAPYSLRVIKVIQVGESIATFQIKSVEGLVLFPTTITQVAYVNYDARWGTHEVGMDCKIVILINDTRFSEVEIPCIDLIGVCSGHRLDSSVGYTREINVDYINGGDRFFSRSMMPSSGIKAAITIGTDELILRNWKSQATTSSMSVLDKNELLFPTVLVGNYCSQYIAVKNPGPEPVLMQLILNSGQVISKCRISEMPLQPSSSSTLVGNNSIAPTRYGFSLSKDARTEAFIHPYGSATLGPILFQPSNRCEWRSSALIRNNLSGVEWLSMQAFGGSLSLVLHEGYDPVQNLEFKLNLPTRINFSFPDTLHSTGSKKTSYCSQPLTKEVYAKNMGDLPLSVIRIEVSGADCGLDGFTIRNCSGFALQPGESTRLHISYQTDFTTATIRRDLELVLGAGIIVIPMKASIPVCLLNFCRKSMFWIRVKKAIVVLLFATSLTYFVVSLLFPHVMTAAFSPRDFVSGKKDSFSSVVIHALNFFHTRFNWKNGSALFSETNEVVKSISHEEALLMECRGNENSSEVPSSPSSVLNVDMEGTLDSRDLRVRIGKEKGRRRRKKRSSGVGILLSEASSSQSSNSTPSSPLSPCITPKKSVEARNPFSHAPLEQSDRTKGSQIPSKFNSHLDNEVRSKSGNKNQASLAHEKPYLAKKVAGKAVVLNSPSSPSGVGGTLPPWTSRSSLLAPTSTIAPYARAPGSKLENQKSVGREEKMGVEQNYTYDIWGDHLFGLPLAYQSKKVSSKPPSSPIKNGSESFFVRGPLKNSQLQSVVSDLEGNE